MNWYQFKVELIAWITKTIVCTTVGFFAVKTLAYYGGGQTSWLLAGEFFGAHTWAMPVFIWTLMAMLAFSVHKALAALRTDSRYGER